MVRLRQALSEKRELKAPSGGTMAKPFFKLADKDIAMAFARAYTQTRGTLYYVTTEEELKARLIEIRRDMQNAAMACCNGSLTQFLTQMGFADSFTAQLSQRYPLAVFVCDALEAWDGSIVVSDRLGLGTALQQLPDTCVVIAFTSQLCDDWRAVLRHLQDMYPDAMPDVIVSFKADDCAKTYLILVEDQ